MNRIFASVAVFLTLMSMTSAQEPDTAKILAEQKETATANIKRAGIDKPVIVESTNLILIGALPESKAKTLVEIGQKSFTSAKSTLKFAENETLWPGKLTIYLLGNATQYGTFVRAVEQRRPDKNAWYSVNTRVDTAYVVVAPESGEKSNDAEMQLDVGTMVSVALLTRKAGATPAAPLPEWLMMGFGRSAYYRAEGGSRLSGYKSKAKNAVVGPKAKSAPVRAWDIWNGSRNKEIDVIAASFVDYLATGPDAAKFSKLLNGFKPNEQGVQPGVNEAFESAEWKLDVLEVNWKRWLLTGK